MLSPAEIQPRLEVDELGGITLDPNESGRLNQREAIILAYQLIDAVQRSVDRNQRLTLGYNSSENILRRASSPVGQALSAVRKAI